MGSSRYPGGYWALPFRTPSQLVPLPGSPRLTSRVGSGTWQRVKYPLAAGSPRRIGLQTPRSQEKSALPLAVCIGSGWWRENRRPEFVPLPECPRRPFVIPGNPGNPTVPILVPLPEPVRIAAPLVSLPDLCAPPDDSEGAIRSGKPILISFQHPNRDLCRWAPCRGSRMHRPTPGISGTRLVPRTHSRHKSRSITRATTFGHRLKPSPSSPSGRCLRYERSPSGWRCLHGIRDFVLGLGVPERTRTPGRIDVIAPPRMVTVASDLGFRTRLTPTAYFLSFMAPCPQPDGVPTANPRVGYCRWPKKCLCGEL